jgi:hypothetical protein
MVRFLNFSDGGLNNIHDSNTQYNGRVSATMKQQRISDDNDGRRWDDAGYYSSPNHELMSVGQQSYGNEQ